MADLAVLPGATVAGAAYTARDYAISHLTDPESTKILCSGQYIMQQESDYLNDLSGVAELRISESSLRLFHRSGNRCLSL